jgi:hypothetical protein
MSLLVFVGINLESALTGRRMRSLSITGWENPLLSDSRMWIRDDSTFGVSTVRIYARFKRHAIVLGDCTSFPILHHYQGVYGSTA